MMTVSIDNGVDDHDKPPSESDRIEESCHNSAWEPSLSIHKVVDCAAVGRLWICVDLVRLILHSPSATMIVAITMTSAVICRTSP